MGIYAEYLDTGLGGDPVKLATERKKQLAAIGAIRKRDVLAYAVDVGNEIAHDPNALRGRSWCRDRHGGED